MSNIAGRDFVPEVCKEVNPRSVMIEMRVTIENRGSHESLTYTCNFHPEMFEQPVNIAQVKDKIQEHAQLCCHFITARN